MESWQAAVDAVGLPAIAAIAGAVLLLVLAATLVLLATSPIADRNPDVVPTDRRAGHRCRGCGAPAGAREDAIRDAAAAAAAPRARAASTRKAVEALETALLGADVGVRTTERLIRGLQEGRGHANVALSARLEAEVLAILEAPQVREAADRQTAPDTRPHVIMVVGVNGVGKTTTIGKLAARFTRAGRRTLLVAADTFRAAAIEAAHRLGRAHRRRSRPPAAWR